MKISSVLSVTANVAAFSFSFIHLCLTRIIPLLAIIFAGLFLHILTSLGLTFSPPNYNKSPASDHSGAPPGCNSEYRSAHIDQPPATPINPRPSRSHVATTSSRLAQPVGPVNPARPHQSSHGPLPISRQNRRHHVAVDVTRQQPSDLPPWPHDVPAHPAAVIVPRALPPSMSTVERTVRGHQEGAGLINNKSFYKSSLSKIEWENFMSNFRKHFMLDS